VPLPSHQTCTPTKSNLFLYSPETVIRVPTQYKLLMFHVPNVMSIFHHLGHLSKESIQVLVSLWLRNKIVFCGEGLLDLRPNPNLENHPLSCVCSCLFSIFSTTLHCWKLSLYLQPKDGPYCGDKGPHLTWPVKLFREIKLLGPNLYWIWLSGIIPVQDGAKQVGPLEYAVMKVQKCEKH
jgi:hypothetical protein